MKTLGLIGGTSWLSTVDYYRLINLEINKRLGGLNSAKLVLYSLNYEEAKRFVDENNWKEISALFCGAAERLEKAGIDGLIICANTPHKIADDVQKVIRVPLIHIAEVTAKEIRKKGINKAGLLGTRFTMEDGFFQDKLRQEGIEAVIPEKDEIGFVHNSIFDELGKEIFRPETKQRYVGIIGKLVEKGAEGVIFGCTEIPLLLKQEDCPVPVFDTTVIHAKAAVEFALKD
ncbi:aspartate racemase [Microgenomates group bacterium RBG_16_45_19]|nr:MAG: aspartate racemase [Microgenomates group bacterium RBG_16_45_19]